jgi:gliding motility-associated-like protein
LHSDFFKLDGRPGFREVGFFYFQKSNRMKKLFLLLSLALFVFTNALRSQTNDASRKKIISDLFEEVKKNPLLRGFDVEKVWSIAESKHSDPKVRKEIFNAEKSRFLSERLSKQYGVRPSGKQPFSYSYDESSKTGFINLNPTPLNANCVNAGFENMNFANWTGGTFTNAAATNWNTFTPAWTNGIMTSGNNQLPQAMWPGFTSPYPNRHTIMTIPPTLNNPPNCIGWDSIAVNPTTHLSDIEFVPATANGVTARLGNANNNYNETERLVYTMAVTSLNSQFTISYAVIVYDGGHPAGEQPFFKITTRDQAGNPIAGCGQYQIDASQVSTDPNFIAASSWNSWNNTWTDPVPGGFNSYYYKKWTTVGMDLSAYIGQTITVEFRTGDCIWGGHWGYAYVDASCQPATAVVNMCTGSTTAVLVAPPGYSNYQWYGPNGMTIISGATNDSLNIANAVVGQVYTVVLTNAAGCTSSMQTTLVNTNIQIQTTNSTPSCQGGFSGTASVVPTGSNNGYNYSWTNMSNNQPVGGNTATITGLSPGSYSVQVSSPNCGSATATVTVGVSPPVYYTDVQNFCMNPAQVLAPTPGSNYSWYDPSGFLISGANTATLSVASPVNGSSYTTVFTTPGGCKDSVRITITQVVNQITDTISYCGSVATLTVMTGASNVIWYDANVWPYAQVGTGNPFNVTNPSTSPWWPSYYGAYTNPVTGCKDSLSLYLTNIPSSVYPSNIVGTCVGQSTGSVTINMTSGVAPPYSLTVTGPTNYTNNAAGATVNLTNLAAGTYTVSFNNGQCTATTNFTISSMTVNVNATVAPATICPGQTAVVTFTYGGGAPTSCGPATSGCGTTTVQTLGTGTLQNTSTTWPCVYGNWYSNEKYQILYRASDLSAAGITAGKISSIAFNVASFPAGMNKTFKNYRIKMGCTSAASLDPSGMQWGSIPFVTPVTQTVWGPANYTAVVGWNTHNLTTVWEWDGTSNLIVEICYEWVGPSNYTTNAIMNQTATSYASFLVYYSDGIVACPEPNGSASYMQRPNTRFSTCQSVAVPSDFTYAWSPSTGVSGSPPTVNLNPTQTTTYSCTVTSNVGGCTKLITLPVTVPVPAATATNAGPYCPGNTIQLNATGGGTYSWSGPAGFTSTAQNPTRPLATTLMSGIYTVTVTVNGCTSTATTSVTVNSTLAATATNTGPYCSGGTIQLNTIAGGTYSWTGPGGFTSTLQNPTRGPATTTMSGVYSVTVTSNGCSGTATTTVTVNPTPTVTASNTGPYCAGATIALTATGGGTYSWSGPPAFTSTLANPSIASSSTANGGVYTVTVTATGCTATATTSVTVNALPVPTATNTGPYCSGGTIQLNSTGGGTYSWTGPGAFTSTLQNPTRGPATTTMSGVYTVTVTANSCTATATTSVTVNPTPTVTASNTGPYCAGATIALAATGGGTYSWSGPPAFTSTLANPSVVSSTTANSGVYTVTVTATGCTATATTSVTVNALPVATATNTGPYCSGGTIQLNSTGGGTYSWTGPGAFTSTLQNPTRGPATTAMSGAYTVTVTVNSCTAIATTSVTVNPTPTVTATNTGPYCAGSTISLTATGGGTYNWSGPSTFTSTLATPSIASSTTANGGVYSVTVTATGCTATATTSVTVNALPVPTASNTGPYCTGTSVQLNGTGGGTYSWTGPSGFASALQNPVAGAAGPATSGVYNLTVTVNGCTATATTSVSVNLALTPALSSNSPVCAGTSLNLFCGNGVSWTWTGPNGFSSALQNPVINPATAAATGTYSATVTDAVGCSGTGTLSVVVNPLPVVTVNSTAICNGQAIASLNASGASTYSWSAGTSSSTGASVTASPTVTTQYTVTGTAANTCTSTAVSTVTVNAIPSITVTNNGPYCSGGTIQLNATGGTSYAWTGPNGFSNSTANPSITPATTSEAGQYSVTVTNAAGCTASGTTSVAVNLSLVPGIISNSPVCAGATLNLSCTNGVSWTWTGPNGFNSSLQNPSVNSVTTAAGGTYSLSVVDANGCSGSGTIAVVVNALPVVTVNSTAICNGQATATLTANGASTYSWTTGTNPSTGANVAAAPAVTSQYTVTGTDGNGCVSTAVSTVTVNPIPAITVSNTGPYCVNGTIQLNATGGTNYAWTGPNGFSNTTPGPAITPATTAEAGQYDVVVTDANGCVASGNTTVIVNTSLIPNLTTNSPLCDGAALNLSCTNGVSWNWTGPNGFSDNSQNPTINPATPIASGTYSISLTDVNGCVGTGTIAVVVNALPLVTVNSTSICDGQATASLTASGASGYVWTTGTNPGTGAAVSAAPTTTSQYTVTGTDVNGCVSTAVSTVTVNSIPVITVSNTGPYCVNGTIQLNATGGTTYAWTGPNGFSNATSSPVITPATTAEAGQYDVTVTDVNGCVATGNTTVAVNTSLIPNLSSNSPLCDGAILNLSCTNGVSWTWTGPNGFSDNAQNPTINPVTPIASGTYSISLTDANGCVGTGTIPVVVNALPLVTVNSTAICNGQATATLTANGASTYVWTSGTNPSTGPGVSAAPATTSQYTVTGTDANGCVNTAVSTVTVNSLPVVTVNSTAVCPGFSANLTANGAAIYSWSAGTSPGTGANVSVSPAATSQYTVTGTDANGCFNTAVSTVTVNAQLSVNAGIDDTVCAGNNFTVTATGPAGTSYTWNPGNLSGASQSFVAATSTVFVVDGVDLNGCAGSDTVVITVPSPIVLNAAGFAASCNGVCDGQLVVLATPSTGGFAQYTYSWNPGNYNSPSVLGVCAGTYSVTVTNNAGCIATAAASVTEPAAIIANASAVTPANCNAVCNGAATINASGGTGTFTYSWSSVGMGSNPVNLCAGNYTCTVTDGNNCSVPVTLAITEPAPISVSISPVANICIGQTSSLTASAGGGSGGYTYTWTGGTTPTNLATVSASPGASSSYSVSVTDVNGCAPASASVTVTVNPPLSVTASNDVTLCAGQNTNLSAAASGGDGNYIYTWATGTVPATGQSVNATPSAGTTYTVTLTDGCGSPAASDVVLVTVNPLPVLSVTTDLQSGCAPLCVVFTLASTTTPNLVNWTFTNSQTATGTPTSAICFATAGVYGASVSATDINGCQNTFTNNSLVTVYPVPVPEFSFGPQPATEANPTITFTDLTSGATINSWQWNFGTLDDSSSTVQNPVFSYSSAGAYDVWLTVASVNGCIDSVNHLVVIDPEFALYVPNAFTPDGSNFNETFFAKGIGIDTDHYEMWIYDRWGNMIWHTDDFFTGWDGRVSGREEIVQQDVYVWKIKLQTYTGQKKSYVGHVTVVK